MSQTVLEFNVQPLKRSLAREAATLRTLCDVRGLICISAGTSQLFALKTLTAVVPGVQNYEACHENIREIAESAGDGEQVAFALSHNPVCCSTSDGNVHC